MNHVSLIGRLIKDVAVHQSEKGNSVCRNTLAVQNIYRQNDGDKQTDFIQVIAFGKLAERIQRFVKKGDRLGIEGRIHSRRYKNREGQDVYVTEVIVEECYFLEPKSQEAEPEETDEFASIFTVEGE